MRRRRQEIRARAYEQWEKSGETVRPGCRVQAKRQLDNESGNYKPSGTEEARQVVEDYANDLREALTMPPVDQGSMSMPEIVKQSATVSHSTTDHMSDVDVRADAALSSAT